MKKVLAIFLSLAVLLPARAQFLRPAAADGLFWGGLIGGLSGSGHHGHGFSGRGAAIGAGVGLLAGSLLDASRNYDYYDAPGYDYAAFPGVNVSFGYGYGSCGSSAYVYYAPNRYCAPGYYYRSTRPNYVVSGTVLGAASGALLGAADHHSGQGAAIGAAAGLVLGSVAEHQTRNNERATGSQITVAPATAPVVLPRPTSINPDVSSQPSATSTYYWTPRPQIADAPRVSDAPTF